MADHQSNGSDDLQDIDPRVPESVLRDFEKDTAKKLPIPQATQQSSVPKGPSVFDDLSETEPENQTMGKNLDTGRDVVAPRKPERKQLPVVPEIKAQKVSDIKEFINRIHKTSDYRPVTLPSGGIFYPDGSGYDQGEVYVRPMKAGEEEILSSPNLFKDGRAIEMIFKQCIQFPGKMPLDDPRDLLSLDRTYLLIYLRAISYGGHYECTVNCGTCRAAFDTIIDLDNDLDCEFLDAGSELKEPFESVFPECGIPFYYRLSRGHDEQHILKMDRTRKSKNPNATDQSLLNRASLLVTQIGNEESTGVAVTDPGQIREILSQLVAKDLFHLRQCFDVPPFGVDTRVVLDCPKCGAENIMALPMGVDFFLPRARRNSQA